VLVWAATDGHAQAMAAPYTPPVGESLWVPTPPSFGAAVEPHCDRVRPMVLRPTDEVIPAAPVPFSSTPGSPFYAQAQAVVDQDEANTDETRDIAQFWSDSPGSSGTPGGHWLSIAAQVAEQRELGLDVTVEALARTAVTLHDAFLNCWTWKYRYNLLRPVTYVRRYFGDSHAQWSPRLDTPQFPEYTSGHSVASRAAAVVLTDLLGAVPFTDTALADTDGMDLRTRSFASFSAAAAMAAQSRLYGGIHYPMGIAAGLAQGDQIGGLMLARLGTRRVR
jgi:alkylhydroperoxidase/carboxymuconolactone decarboxylase family protein YurZ